MRFRNFLLSIAIVLLSCMASGCISILSTPSDNGPGRSASSATEKMRKMNVQPYGDTIDTRIWTDGQGLNRSHPRAITSQTYVNLADRVSPAVVSIFTTQRIRTGIGDPLGLFQVPFKDFYAQSLGSGFVIHKNGFVITNAHVVAEADEIQVLLMGNQEPYPARLVGIDTLTDLAILKIRTEDPLPVLKIARSEKVRVGDVAVAIGNPYGLQHSLTIGVISAKGRQISKSSIKAGQEDYLQTSAQINPGNSGGPLINLAGEVMGVNTAIFAQAQGIGFAIPADIVRELIPTLLKDGRVRRSFAGLLFTGKNGAGASSQQGEGVKVYGVYRGSPAALAGILRGDVVQAINGSSAKDPFQASRMIADLPVGAKLTLRIRRNGGEFEVTLYTVEL